MYKGSEIEPFCLQILEHSKEFDNFLEEYEIIKGKRFFLLRLILTKIKGHN
jgi:hypothetical protein